MAGGQRVNISVWHRLAAAEAASVLFFAGLMWLYGERNKILIGLTSILVPVVLFYLFTAGFQILLPRSPL